MNTPIAQAQVMTIHPEFCAFDLFNNTPATTPSPIRISTAVPTTSPMNISSTTSLSVGADLGSARPPYGTPRHPEPQRPIRVPNVRYGRNPFGIVEQLARGLSG
jgi:hypothetical protein